MIDGFDYRLGVPVSKDRHEWRETLRKLIADGGRRRVSDGETFGHDKQGKIQFEIYANVAV